MTRKETIKALGLMEHVESIVATYEPGERREDTTVRELKEACRMAAAVLRAQQATDDAIEGLCCDCAHGGPCCDYSENEWCEHRCADGSCWIPRRPAKLGRSRWEGCEVRNV